MEFTIGLCERDVWTAVLTAGMMNGDDMTTMLQVVSPGKADGKVDDANYEEPPMEDDDGKYTNARDRGRYCWLY